jgi:hypothetical protein
MTSGLQWWHEVCAEVREDGQRMAVASNGPGYFETAGCDQVDELIQRIVNDSRKWRVIPGTGIKEATRGGTVTERAQKFLRTQWQAAYRKARQS